MNICKDENPHRQKSKISLKAKVSTRHIRKLDAIEALCEGIKDPDIDLICPECSFELSRTIEMKYEETRQRIRTYDIYQHEMSQKSDCSISTIMYGSDKDSLSDPEMKSSILATTEFDLRELMNEYLECKAQLQHVDESRFQIAIEVDDELRLISDLERKINMTRDEIVVSLEILESIGSEVQCISECSVSPMFDIFISSIGLYAINGFRLCYEPVPRYNLNWAEINVAWGCLSLFICAIRNRAKLSLQVDLYYSSHQIDEHIDTSRGTRHHLLLSVRPLRHRALLLLDHIVSSVDGTKLNCKHVGGRIVSESADSESSSLCGSKVCCLGGGQESIYSYHEAVLLFAAYVAITASQLQREEVFEGTMLPLWESLQSNEFIDVQHSNHQLASVRSWSGMSRHGSLYNSRAFILYSRTYSLVFNVFNI